MARQFVVFALVVFAVVGLSCAATPAETPKGAPNTTDEKAPLLPAGADNSTVGADAPGADKGAVEAPTGGPAGEGATGLSPAESPKGAASALEFSTVATVAAVAAFFF